MPWPCSSALSSVGTSLNSWYSSLFLLDRFPWSWATCDWRGLFSTWGRELGPEWLPMVGGRVDFPSAKCKFQFGWWWLIQACLPPSETLPLEGIPQIPSGTQFSVDESVSSPGPRSQYQACQHVPPNLFWTISFSKNMSHLSWGLFQLQHVYIIKRTKALD